MTNYFLNPLGSRRWLPSNVLELGGTHSAMLTSLGQQLIGDEISAAAVHDQSFARKSYHYYHQGAPGDNTTGFLVHQDPLAALARGKYASSNLLLPQTVVATTTSSSSPSPPPSCSNSPSSAVVLVVGNDAGGYLMRSVDSLVGAASPQSHDTFLSFIKSPEDRINAEESDSVTVNSFFSAPGGKQAGGARGFELSSTKLSGDDAVLTSPGVIQASIAVAAAVDDASDAGIIALQRAIMEPMEVVLAQSLESSLGNKFADNFLESIEEDLKASFGYQESVDGSLDQEEVVQERRNLQQQQQQQQESASYGTQQGRAPSGMSILWPHEEEQCDEGRAQRSNCWSTHPIDSVVPSLRFASSLKRDSHEDDEGLLRLLREAAGEEARGLFEDEIEDAGEGQAQNLHHNSSTSLKQLSDQSLHISSSSQYPPLSSDRVAFPEAVAMESPQNQVTLAHNGAKPSGLTHGLRACDDTPAAPLQPPNVQNFAANRGRIGSSSSRSPAAEMRVSDRHETLKWLGTAGSYRNSNGVAGVSQMKSGAGRDRAHDDRLLALGTSTNHSPVQNTAANSNPCSTSSPSSSASLAQSPFKSQGSSSKSLNDAPAENQAQKRRPYSEINGLLELMSTEHKPYLEIAALDTTTINPAPSRALHKMEDALKIAVSNSIARKRTSSQPHANQQQQQQKHDSNDFQSSKKQKVRRKPISPSATERHSRVRKEITPAAAEPEHHSRLPEGISPPAAAEFEHHSMVPEEIATPAAAEVECHSRVPEEIMPAATELECHSREPEEIITLAAAELECHSRVPEETMPAAAELECHSGMPEITPAAGGSWISNESAKVAMPQVLVVNVEDSMGVEYWENLLAAGFAGEHDKCIPHRDDDDDDFVNVELNARPQSPLSDFSSGMAMLFDYL